MDKFKRANDYFHAWIKSNGRFDLNDLADRAGVSAELDHIRKDVLALLEDETCVAESYEIFCEEKAVQEKPFVTDYLLELTKRYFG
jgi:hypothetical protein